MDDSDEKPNKESGGLLDRVRDLPGKMKESLSKEPKNFQEAAWAVEKKVKVMDKTLDKMSKKMDNIFEKVDTFEELFLSIKEGQEKEQEYRESHHEELVNEIERQKKEIHAAAMIIQKLKTEDRPFWNSSKSALLSFILTLIFGIVSGYLQTNYDSVYAAWFFWFAALSACSTLIFVVSAAFKKEEV